MKINGRIENKVYVSIIRSDCLTTIPIGEFGDTWWENKTEFINVIACGYDSQNISKSSFAQDNIDLAFASKINLKWP